ncbi:Na+/H+ antiporter [Roseateles violae]|uniref:Na+/H+ antiporter n=1 Tax=Roseateles violae TaxID=3058042 RepID=A0ABT8DVA6_9BURK|nr:Na+/H+ antiporter [Pelomonas sp. PFR6]MDN3922073.1 Na+/H+ antiporter [Pelomonas sp. PFR6]
MHSIEAVLTLLLAVAASGYLVWALPFSLPLPLVQIGLGALIAGVLHRGHALEPELFFLLFLPPLLFLDGWRIPKQGLVRDRRAILQLALGLVVFTVVGAGYLIHWMIPTMPLALAFALAAVVSPTDPVAVSGIATRTTIPPRLKHILEGESLLNDASGLVCFQFAVAAVLTGGFSLRAAGISFLWVAGVGLACGVLAVRLINLAQDWIWRRIGDEVGPAILVNLLTPFAAYLLAEGLQASGILAAVAAGITMSFIELSGKATGNLRVQRAAIWDMVQFSFNGIMFVLLGEQLPGIWSAALQSLPASGRSSPWWLLAYALALSAGLMLLRFVWVWVSLHGVSLLQRLRGRPVLLPPWQIVLATALAGVRGAITLAGVLTLPLALPDGSPLPARALVVFLAAAVILISLAVATVALPRLLQGLQLREESSEQLQEELARQQSAKAALAAIEALRLRLVEEAASGQADAAPVPPARAAAVYNEAAARIALRYQHIVQRGGTAGSGEGEENALQDLQRLEQALQQLRQAGLAAERSELFRLARRGKISDALSRRLVRDLDLLDSREQR